MLFSDEKKLSGEGIVPSGKGISPSPGPITFSAPTWKWDYAHEYIPTAKILATACVH